MKFSNLPGIIYMEIIGIVGETAEMFHVNDVIVYGTQGVCQIAGIEEKTLSGVKRLYFVLKPVKDSGSTIFVPTDNECVLSKMHRLLSETEINDLIDSMPGEDALWIQKDYDRKECYRKILASGDHGELIKMIKTIYIHKKEREAEGKRLHALDEQFFKEAEHILYNELQYVLKLSSKDEVTAYIFSRIEKGNKKE